MKNIIKLIINKFYTLNQNGLSFDEIYLFNFKKNNIVIFDCGAGEGDSILRFKKLFPNSFIHSFDVFFENLQIKYKDRNDIIINN